MILLCLKKPNGIGTFIFSTFVLIGFLYNLEVFVVVCLYFISFSRMVVSLFTKDTSHSFSNNLFTIYIFLPSKLLITLPFIFKSIFLIIPRPKFCIYRILYSSSVVTLGNSNVKNTLER